MPARNPFDSPNRLRLGQGVAGGGAALPTLGAPDPTPKPPVGLPRPHAVAPVARLDQPHLPMLPGGPGVTQDVTPPGVHAAPQYAGEAYLRRFGNILGPQAPLKGGKGLQKTIKILQSPDTAFEPGNKRNLKLIMKPGPQVQALIDTDPHLKANQMALQNHVITNGPVKLPAQDLIKKLHATVGEGKMNLQDFIAQHQAQLMKLDDTSKQRFSQAVDVANHNSQMKNLAAGKPDVAGFQEPIQKVYDSNIFGNAFEQAFNTVTGMVPGTYQLARHPVKSVEAMAKSTGHYYGPLFEGHPGKFAENVGREPLTPIFDATAVYGAAAGAAGRLAAVGDATSALRAASSVEDLGNGAARVGGRYTVHPMNNGRYMVRDSQTNRMVTNTPDATSAVAHAQSLGGAAADKSIFRTALHAFTHPEMYGKARGSILDQYEKHSDAAQVRIDRENKNLIEQLQDVADDPNLRLNRRSRAEVLAHAKADFHATMADLRGRPEDIMKEEPEFHNRATSNVKAGVIQGYRELMAGIRLGAIYLRPAYLPNNWAGNAFMNLTHQGFLAPVNLAKSVVMHNKMDGRNMAMIDKAMGQNAAQSVYEGIPRGFVSSAGHPLVDVMGKIADQPFRRAAFLHEARRMGYRKLGDVNQLLHDFRNGDEKAQTAVANIGRRAQEEIVKFGHMGEKEKALANNLFFVYNWVKGSTRYAARFPLQHPIQTDLYAHDQEVGHDWVNKQMGGVPWFLAGSIPVGRKANGDPILINPFALNPLGTSVDVARAASGSYKALVNPKKFNKYSDSTLVDLTNPLIQTVAKHFLGGDTQSTQYELSQTIAPWRFAQDWMHPGRGSMFPMSRAEALGHFIVGSLWPRRASQDAISRALERQNANNPQALLDQQVKDYEKQTGQKVAPLLVSKVKGDLDALQTIKDFQTKYAESKGSQGFKNLPPVNQAEAALQYLKQYGHLPKEDLKSYEDAVNSAPTDAVRTQLANALWGMTNAGIYKRHWDEMKNAVKGTKLTEKRK